MTQRHKRAGQQKKRTLDAGFTLIELMIVAGLIAILTSIAVPSYSRMIKRSRAESVAESAKEALIAARNTARVTLRCVTVTVTASPGSITYQSYEPGAADCSTLGSAVGAAVTIPVVPESGMIPVTLSPAGSPLFVFNTRGGLVGDIIKEVHVKTEFSHYTFKIWPAIGAIRKYKG